MNVEMRACACSLRSPRLRTGAATRAAASHGSCEVRDGFPTTNLGYIQCRASYRIAVRGYLMHTRAWVGAVATGSHGRVAGKVHGLSEGGWEEGEEEERPWNMHRSGESLYVFRVFDS